MFLDELIKKQAREKIIVGSIYTAFVILFGIAFGQKLFIMDSRSRGLIIVVFLFFLGAGLLFIVRGIMEIKNKANSLIYKQIKKYGNHKVDFDQINKEYKTALYTKRGIIITKNWFVFVKNDILVTKIKNIVKIEKKLLWPRRYNGFRIHAIAIEEKDKNNPIIALAYTKKKRDLIVRTLLQLKKN